MNRSARLPVRALPLLQYLILRNITCSAIVDWPSAARVQKLLQWVASKPAISESPHTGVGTITQYSAQVPSIAKCLTHVGTSTQEYYSSTSSALL